MRRMLVAGEKSGRIREAFRRRGWDAWSCDLLPSEDNSPFHIQGDAREVAYDRSQKWDMMIGHPVCTYLTNSGVRWLHTELGRDIKMKAGAKFFADLLKAPIPKIALENPVMHGYAVEEINALMGDMFDMRSYTRYYQPWWFGAKQFKLTGMTCLNLPFLTKPATALTPPKKGTPEHKDWSSVHLASPGPLRAEFRSRTQPEVAEGIAEQWAKLR